MSSVSIPTPGLDALDEAVDFEDLGSVTCSRRTAVKVDRFAGSLVTSGNPDNPAAWGTGDQGNEFRRTYGAFIASPIGPDLAPFIQARINDDTSGSKRIERYRLARADNQAAVRFRFAHAGADSWYWGFDDFGLYSIPNQPTPPGPLTVKLADGRVSVAYPGTLHSAATATGPWTDVTGATSPYSTTPAGTARFNRSRPNRATRGIRLPGRPVCRPAAPDSGPRPWQCPDPNSIRTRAAPGFEPTSQPVRPRPDPAPSPPETRPKQPVT